MIQQNNYFNEVIYERRRSPTNSIVSQLIETEVDGEKLSDDMLNNTLDLLLRAGFLTTVHQLGNGLLQLARQPELRQKLIHSPELISSFVDEILRLHSSIPMTIRHTTQDITLHGITIPKGKQVALLLAAANRDPRKFQNPDNIDLSRTPAEHIVFGYGPHLCIGLALARMELEVAFESLLSKVEYLSCPDEQQLKWITSSLVRGLEKLPIVIH